MNTIILSDSAQENFYPTPPDVAAAMLEGIDLQYVESILEPSAGTGNLIHALCCAAVGTYNKLHIDAVELDPNLRSLLVDTYGGRALESLRTEARDLEQKSRLEKPFSEVDQEHLREIRREEKILDQIEDFYVVHDDFLTFDTRKRYNLILMNPPFADGDAHLLKAISLLAPSGQIRCLLNAETLRNPYSNRRKELQKVLSEMDAEIQYLGTCFDQAERRTHVDVAMVSLRKPEATYKSRIWEEMEQASQAEFAAEEVRDITVTDLIENRVSHFNLECDAALTLLREYEGMKPYILKGTDRYAKPIIDLRVGNHDATPNRLLRLIRAKYWDELLKNPQFVSRMTSDIRNEYCSKVDEMANYDFSLYNIRRVMLEIQEQLLSGATGSILSLFETLSAQHAWYPECENNIHYYNGWAANKAHAVNRKCIIPCYGMFGMNSYDKGRFYAYKACEFLADLEKALDYLTASPGDETNYLSMTLDAAERAGETKNINLRYFKVTFYKKGTCHITFHDQAVVDKLNIFCAREKHWLPPHYGKKKYADMTSEEKAVVDGIHGDGTEGSGHKGYAKVLESPSYYLAELGGESNSLSLLPTARENANSFS